jgi:predicted phage terminase large subunit-like protein
MPPQQSVSVTGSLNSLTHRELAEQSTPYYMGYYLGMWTLPHRVEMLEHIEGDDQFILLLYPRDHLKTSTVTGWITKQLTYNSSLRVLCVSNTKELALQNIGAIREQLELNDKLRRDFGVFRGESWGKEKFTLNRPPTTMKEPSCIARSLGASVLGMHFDIIWCDDIVEVENQYTQQQREKVEEWFWGKLYKCLDRRGKLIVTGTRKNIQDIYATLKSRETWKTYTYRAIIDEEQQTVLAPWLYPYTRLVMERINMGSLKFAREMQNEPIEAKGLVLKRDWVQFYDLSDPPNFNWIYAGVDPAVGKSDIASFTAVVLVGVTPDHRFYVLDMQRHRWPVDWEKQCKAILQSYVDRNWVPTLTAVEDVITFKYITAPLTSIWQGPIRFVDYKQAGDTQIKDKVARIQSLGVYFEQGRVFLPDPNQYPMTVKFMDDEYLQFPEGEFTDLLDALNLAIQAHASMPSGDAAFRIG